MSEIEAQIPATEINYDQVMTNIDSVRESAKQMFGIYPKVHFIFPISFMLKIPASIIPIVRSLHVPIKKYQQDYKAIFSIHHPDQFFHVKTKLNQLILSIIENDLKNTLNGKDMAQNEFFPNSSSDEHLNAAVFHPTERFTFDDIQMEIGTIREQVFNLFGLYPHVHVVFPLSFSMKLPEKYALIANELNFKIMKWKDHLRLKFSAQTPFDVLEVIIQMKAFNKKLREYESLSLM